MAKTAAQKAARKLKKAMKRKLANLVNSGAKQHMAASSSPPKQAKAKKKKKKTKQSTSNAISMVTDGVNCGSVWKNTTAVRQPFALAREKFADLTSTGTTFQTLSQMYLNPGNTSLFPVFAEIAKNYEEFECDHMKIFFRTEEYMASGSTVSAGLAGIGVNFDPDATNFANMTELENYTHSISGPPFSGIMVMDVLEERRKHAANKKGNLALNNYFVNYSPNTSAPPTAATSVPKFFDMGNLQCCVNGTQAGIIGELWIEYRFTMIRRLQTPGAVDGGVAHWSAVAATTANNLGLATLQSGNTLAGITMTANTITFPANAPGNYLCVASIAGATGASAFNISSVTGGVSSLNILSQSAVRDAVNVTNSNAGTTTGPAFCLFTVSVTTAGGTVILSGSVITGAGTVDVFIVSLPATVLTLIDKEKADVNALTKRADEQDRKIAELVRMLTHCNSPTPESDSGIVVPEMSGSIHIPRGLLAQYLQGADGAASSSTARA